MGSCIDLRKYQDNEEVYAAFSALVSGKKSGYKTIIEKKKEILKCSGCQLTLNGDEKFCPECGTRVVKAVENKNVSAQPMAN
ncbi:hypothetical protein HYV50_01815 [Candidatus Pacearchaeota archaeon]|nr:hypothetical protein [Candidatus Pacearchaeota archaeon]